LAFLNRDDDVMGSLNICMVSQLERKGLLFLIGGGEDRSGEKKVLRHLIQKTHSRCIVIIPTASNYPRDIERSYTEVFRDLGVDDITCLDIRYADEADRDEHFEAINQTDLIFFGGGDQAKLVKRLIKTRLFELIKTRFETEELHVAGTSAGASAAGHPVFYNGNRQGLKKGSIKYIDGFRLIDGVAIDTHFTNRNRLPRLCQMLVTGQCKKGIGLDEDTGIMIDPLQRFTVIGSGKVTVANSVGVSGSNYNAITKGDIIRFNNLRIGSLPPGTVFSIKRWTILNRK
jgi:cyanophycinase